VHGRTGRGLLVHLLWVLRVPMGMLTDAVISARAVRTWNITAVRAADQTALDDTPPDLIAEPAFSAL